MSSVMRNGEERKRPSWVYKRSEKELNSAKVTATDSLEMLESIRNAVEELTAEVRKISRAFKEGA